MDGIFRSDLDQISRVDRNLIATILLERGPSCSSSKELFRQVLKDTGIPLTEDQLAGIIVVLVNKFVNSTAELGGIDDGSNKWNLDNVADVLSVEAKGLNWTAVVHYFDQPQLVIRFEAMFVFIARMFVRIAGMAVPAAGLVGTWVNKHTQLAMLLLAANAPRNLVDFSAIVSAEQQLPGEVPAPNNYSWLSLPLYTTLLQLASSGLNMEVLEAFTNAAANYPEYVTICLAQVQDLNSGVRAEILRRTLPLFSGLPGSRPTSMVVMRKLSTVNPDLLVLLFRIALKRANKVQDIIDIDTRIKTFGQMIAKRLEDEAGIDENVGYWCVKADRSDFNFEGRISTVIDMNPQQNCRALLNFVKSHVETLRPRNMDGGLLSFECFGIILRALQLYPTIVSIDELRSLAAVVTQHQHNIQQHNLVNQSLMNPGAISSLSSTSQNSIMGQGLQLGPSSISQSLNIGPVVTHGVDVAGPHGMGDRNIGPESDDIDEEANSYFQKIYTSEISIPDVITLLKRFKASTEKREQEVFRCMIHNLFDEYRFFHKYPDKELHITGTLFGSLIQHQLVSSITLGIALRYVLEALRKDPEQGGSNEKMFRFGKLALEQFRARLVEWPQYCSHVIQIPHLSRHSVELYHEAQRALNHPTVQSGNSPFNPQTSSSPSDFSTNPMPPGALSLSGSQSSEYSQNYKSISSEEANNINIGFTSGVLPKDKQEDSPSPSVNDDGIEDSQNSQPPSYINYATENVSEKHALPQQTSQISAATGDPLSTHVSKPPVIERMAVVNIELSNTVVPPENTRDKMHMIVNNIDKNNVEVKSNELKQYVISDYYNWFANYLVVKRISAQPNLHPLYLTLIDTLDNPELNSVVLDSTYHNATKLLMSPKITTSSTERTLLRNLGIWLGLMTLARNKPLLHRRMEIKELLFWGYETGRLIAVCSFVARILEGVKESKVFRPPNPWLMGVLSVMKELYEIDDLKMNIKFEVQVLCKNISVKIEDIPKGNLLSNCKTPIKDLRNPDFNVKNLSGVAVAVTTPPTTAMPSAASPQITGFNSPTMTPMALPKNADEESSMPANAHLSNVISNTASSNVSVQQSPVVSVPSAPSTAQTVSAPGGVANQEQTVIPNLSAFVTINPSLQFFTSNPAQRRLVSIAVDRAIRELIQPVAERSVTIASVTTKQLITKDFSTEPNEQQLRRHAHLMIANLAGSLALVTCKEPLRLSICNHLRSLLSQATSDQALIEQIVQVCSNDNLDIGCKLIEKAATEKAILVCDESLSAAYQARRKSREQTPAGGQLFTDVNVPKGSKYPKELPDVLKPRVGGLLPQQLQLYEGFQRIRTAPSASISQPVSGSPNSSSLPGPIASNVDMKPLPASMNLPNVPLLSMAQALEGYQFILNRIEVSLRTIQSQAQGRDVSFSMLGSENEILTYLREIINITQRIQPVARNEAAMTFAETVFKRLFESLGSLETLKGEVFVAILEALRDVSGGPKKLSTEMISWLNAYSTFNIADEKTQMTLKNILMLFLRVKLLRSQDIDTYFSAYMDSGKSMIWVQTALEFVKQCVADNLAVTYEFASTFDTVSKIKPTNVNVRKNLQKILTDLRALATSKEDQKLGNVAQNPNGPALNTVNSTPSGTQSSIDASLREHVTFLLEKWLRVFSTVNDAIFAQYLQLMHQHGVFKTEEAADKFFKVATELCIEACLKTSNPNTLAQVNTTATSSIETGLVFTVIDALSKLFILLMRVAEKEASEITVRVNLLGRILNAIARSLIEDHEMKMNMMANPDSNLSKIPAFDQRPYFRLLSNLASDFNIPDAKKEVNPTVLPVAVPFAQVYLMIHPGVVPGFAFGWLQLISQRTFLPHLMLAKSQKGWPFIHKLVLLMLNFLYPHLRNAQLSEPIRKLYKGTLRVLLMLLHDFPEFLCEYQLTLCDAIPLNCIQLRNLVLSAIPRTMRLPDPFTPNLKVDLLPEISQPPRLLAEYFTVLNDRGIRPRIDSYFTNRSPAELPTLLPRVVLQASGLPDVGSVAAAGGSLNIPLLNAIIVYVGTLGAAQLQNKVSLPTSPALEIFKGFVNTFDAEGRNIVLNFMVNQLRYPNSHTHFFSYVILLLFLDAETSNDVFLQEQIARVLLERLIVHKPHPVS